MPPNAARVTTRIATCATPRGATVYTNAPKRLRETISTNLCTLLCPHGRSCDRSAGRFLEQRALPLGGERVVVERSGPSGSATHTRPHAQGRVAARLTLPNGIERTKAVRSGSSGSAIGTLKGEWQYSLHCHSTVNVRAWSVQARVAVRSVRSRVSGSVIHTRPHAQGRVAARLTLPNGIERTKAVRSGPSGSAIGTLKGEWQCSLHCHSAVNVWWWNVQARVAV